MKRQSSEAVIEDSDESPLNHNRTEHEEDFASPILKRQAPPSTISDSILTTKTTARNNEAVSDVLGTSPFPNGALPLRVEHISDVGPSARKAFTKDKSRNGRGVLISKLPGNAKEQHGTARPAVHRTGLAFARSPKHFDPSNPLHRERESRIESVEKALGDACLLGKCHVVAAASGQVIDEDAFTAAGGSNSSLLSSARLSEQDFTKVHRPAFLKRLERLSTLSSLHDVAQESEQYQSMYLTPHSYDEAKAASNGLCELVRLVLLGELRNGFAVIRPPGHHAEPSLAGGYCVLNHVAIAARYAQSLSSPLGSGVSVASALPLTKSHHRVERVLVVDWDVHHGNGTQSIFESDPSVLYFSVHRWHSGRYYPHHSNGGPSKVGVCRCPSDGSVAARNVNVGWTSEGMGDDEYRAVWKLLLIPMAREFHPDLILVSAGFDAAAGDVGDCHVTPECFAFLTKQLRRLAGGRVVCSLEGGYVRSVLGACVTRVVEALLSDLDGTEEGDGDVDGTITARAKILESIDPVAAQDIRSTMEAHRPYWRCLSWSGDAMLQR